MATKPLNWLSVRPLRSGLDVAERDFRSDDGRSRCLLQLIYDGGSLIYDCTPPLDRASVQLILFVTPNLSNLSNGQDLARYRNHLSSFHSPQYTQTQSCCDAARTLISCTALARPPLYNSCSKCTGSDARCHVAARHHARSKLAVKPRSATPYSMRPASNFSEPLRAVLPPCRRIAGKLQFQAIFSMLFVPTPAAMVRRSLEKFVKNTMPSKVSGKLCRLFRL